MSTGDVKNVSTIGINEGITYLKNEFISKLDENVSDITTEYSSLQGGVLSSGNIDMLVAGINNEITKLQNNFDDLASKLVTTMSASTESITQSTSNIESTLSQG